MIKRLLYLFACLLMVFSVSCGGVNYFTYTANDAAEHVIHPVHIPIWIDNTFSQKQVEEIKAATAEWNYVLNGQMVLHVMTHQAMGVDKQMREYPAGFDTWEEGRKLVKETEKTDLGWVIFNVPTTSPHLDKNTGDGVLAYVTGIDEHFIIVISDRFGSRSFKDVIMHEMAHLLGAMHVRAPSLEYPIYSSAQYSCIDKITVAQVAQVRKLDMDHLNYCVTPHFE